MENKANREKEHQSILVRLSLQTFIFVVCSLSSIVGKLSVFQMRYDLVTADDVRGGDFLPATIRYAPLLRHHTRGARVCADLWMLRQQETVVTACLKTRCERGKKERKKDRKKARKVKRPAASKEQTGDVLGSRAARIKNCESSRQYAKGASPSP